MRIFVHTDTPGRSGAAAHDAILATMEALAVAAGRELMAVFRAGVAEASADHDAAVAGAARAAERRIIAALAALPGGRACVAEQDEAAGIAARALTDEFFLVKALDGGRALLAGRPDFTVNIALVRDGAPVIGVVFAPAWRELYTGWPGGAAIAIVERGLRRARTGPISVRPRPREPRVVASRSPLTAATEAYLREWPRAEVMALGSSLKFCLIARGEADLYPCFGRTMEWDTAAGHAVLLGAGGRVCADDGQALAYGKIARADIDFANPPFVADGGEHGKERA